MAFSPRLSVLVLLLAYAALLEPARAAGSPPPAADLESRLDRISRALQDRVGAGSLPAHLDGAMARGFANGPRRGFANGPWRGFANGPRGGFANAAYRGGFANVHPYYGGPARTFVNGGGGYHGGGFVNARPRGGGFVNW
ncbi:MAG: GrrA/OscA1 family cyclophane-containing rSAM-modified RiPP [Cyanobacteria bacterium J06638_7]